jgi:hypothetical protein
MRTSTSRTTSENADAVGLVVALLVRFPEIATLVSHPSAGTLTVSFAIAKKLDRASQREVRSLLLDHVRSYAELVAESLETIEVACESDESMTFVRMTRDARTVTREELQLVTALVARRFGALLIKSAVAEDEAIDDDPGAQDDLVDYALDALRDPEQKKSLVGFREEKRVMVYFVSARKKAKARGRS